MKPRVGYENGATGSAPPRRLFGAILFSSASFFLLAGVSTHSEKEKRNKRGTRVKNAVRANEKDERNLVNGAVNLESRPIISLLPTFLDARHFFGYDPTQNLLYTRVVLAKEEERERRIGGKMVLYTRGH